jgi:hypothetical protein
MGPLAAIRAYLTESRMLRKGRSPEQDAFMRREDARRNMFMFWVIDPPEPGPHQQAKPTDRRPPSAGV